MKVYLLAPGVSHSGLLPGQSLLPPVFLTVGGDSAREGTEARVAAVGQLDSVAEVRLWAGLSWKEVVCIGADGGQGNTTRKRRSVGSHTREFSYLEWGRDS